MGALRKAKRTDDRHLVLAKMPPRVFNVDSGWIKKRDFKKIHVIGRSCVYGALCTRPIPTHCPHACMYSKPFHGLMPSFYMAVRSIQLLASSHGH